MPGLLDIASRPSHGGWRACDAIRKDHNRLRFERDDQRF